ncbi:MAG: flagellar hook-length control protein FliK [Bdellovibrionota bacterium]
MNPTMSATGDPIMILFPAVIGGLLANFETSFYPPVQNEDQNKKKKEQEKTERAAISVNLPGLGEVSVEISIKKNQPEVIFKVETDEIYEFMRSQLNSFAKRLATDFEDSKVIIETKPKVEVVPEWLQTLVQDAAVVA